MNDDLRDARVDAAWQAASREEPPRALDDAIRAAARREIGAGPQARAARSSSVPQSLRPERWWWPLAAAATIGAVAIGLMQLVEPERVVAPASEKESVSDMPQSVLKASKQEMLEPPAPMLAPAPMMTPAPMMAPAPMAPDLAEERHATPAILQQTEPLPAPPPLTLPPSKTLRKDIATPFPREEGARSSATTMPSAPVERGVVSAPAPASPPVAMPFPTDKLESKELAKRDSATPYAMQEPAPRRAQESVDARSAPAAALAQANRFAEPRAKVAPKLPVDDWIALIRKLRDAGKTDEALKELVAFRNAYADPEQLLPPDLRDWKPAQ